MSVLSPFVYWAQNISSIYLKIDLKDVKDPDIVVRDHSISFNGTGKGAQGFQEYSFILSLFEKLNENEKNIKISDNSINITLTKAESGWWPRLISTPQKPTWLKIDFDKWQSEDDLLDEQVTDIRDDYPDVYKNLMKNELGYLKEDFKAVYMVFYNFAMLCAFLYASIVLAITITKNGLEESTYAKVYPSLGHIVCLIQIFQALEIIHPILGYVRGSAVMPFIQIWGRLFILYGNLEFESRLQKIPATTWVFAVWIYSDVIRYIYYIFKMADSKNVIKRKAYPFFKWLRYSAWIILYPIGFVCESVIIFTNITYLHGNPRWSVTLPNSYNFTFDYLTFLRIYMLFIMFPGMFTLLKHMYKARVKQLGAHAPFDKISLLKQKVK